MPVTDPREEYDDLVVTREEERVDAGEFAAAREMEAFQSGWVSVGIVLDDGGRVLLAYDEDDECWICPGGTLQRGESLREGLVREVREETGVEVTPVRPYGVSEYTIRHGDEHAGFTTVVFESRAETTAIGADLGEDDESITDAAWFDELPEDTFERAFAQRVLRRCRD